MKLRLSILSVMLLCALFVQADVLVLRTGSTVEGTILLENEQVVIIRDSKGGRFQYPRADVQEIRAEGAETIAVTSVAEPEKNSELGARKVSLGVEVRGGGTTTGENRWGGAVGANLLAGTARIAGKEILLGGMFGYEGRWVAGEQAHYLPIQVAARIPLMDTRHAPFLGVNMGYGIGIKGTKGGMHAGVGFGYRCRMGEHSALLIGADVTWQQTAINQTTSFSIADNDGNETTRDYIATAYNLVEVGMKFGFLF